MDYFNDVPARVASTHCVKCHVAFQRRDNIHVVKIVAGVGKHPRGFGECTYVSDFEEMAHLNCADTTLRDPFIELPRSALAVSKDIQQLQARTPDYICAVCKKRLRREDRIFLTLIVEGVTRDPENNNKAIQCSPEYETVHVNCRDTALTGGG